MGDNIDIEKYEIFKDSFNKNMDTHDKLVEELYEYNKLITQGTEYDSKSSTTFQNKYQGENANDMDEKLYEIIEKNQDLKSELMEIVNNDTFLLDEELDMYKNKKFMNEILNHKLDVLEKTNDKMTYDMSSKQRNVELGVYAFQRNKSLIKMLYTLIIYIITICVIHYFNNNIFPLKDSVYAIIIGVITSIFIITILYRIYDFSRRSEHIFDEYNSYWDGKTGLGLKENKYKINMGLCTDDEDDENSSSE